MSCLHNTRGILFSSAVLRFHYTTYAAAAAHNIPLRSPRRTTFGEGFASLFSVQQMVFLFPLLPGCHHHSHIFSAFNTYLFITVVVIIVTIHFDCLSCTDVKAKNENTGPQPTHNGTKFFSNKKKYNFLSKQNHSAIATDDVFHEKNQNRLKPKVDIPKVSNKEKSIYLRLLSELVGEEMIKAICIFVKRKNINSVLHRKSGNCRNTGRSIGGVRPKCRQPQLSAA